MNWIQGTLSEGEEEDLSLTIEILKSLKNIDIEETVIFLKEYGGHCDCKVIMNVARIWNNR